MGLRAAVRRGAAQGAGLARLQVIAVLDMACRIEMHQDGVRQERPPMMMMGDGRPAVTETARNSFMLCRSSSRLPLPVIPIEGVQCTVDSVTSPLHHAAGWPPYSLQTETEEARCQNPPQLNVPPFTTSTLKPYTHSDECALVPKA